MTDAAIETPGAGGNTPPLPPRGPGDNMPPPDANPLRDRLTLDHASLTARLNEL